MMKNWEPFVEGPEFCCGGVNMGVFWGKGGERGEEEGKTYSHAQNTRGIMFKYEVLIGEGFGAVDGGAACAVAVEEIAALDHEVFDLDRRCVSPFLYKL